MIFFERTIAFLEQLPYLRHCMQIVAVADIAVCCGLLEVPVSVAAMLAFFADCLAS